MPRVEVGGGTAEISCPGASSICSDYFSTDPATQDNCDLDGAGGRTSEHAACMVAG